MRAEDQILENLRRSERRYHLFKAFLILISASLIIYVTIYEAHKSEQNTFKTRDQVTCLIKAFTPENYLNSTQLIERCIKENK